MKAGAEVLLRPEPSQTKSEFLIYPMKQGRIVFTRRMRTFVQMNLHPII